jgi:hypothetical protein
MFGAGLGGYLNPSSYSTLAGNIPYLAAGVLLVFVCAFVLLKIYSLKSGSRMKNGHDAYAV